jgi:hypothetical protein
MSGPYQIRVYDNFHYMDRDESYLLGPLATAEEALEVAQTIVREFLEEAADEHRTAEALVSHYRSFGEDPTILGEPAIEFSAWDYAEALAREIAATSTP